MISSVDPGPAPPDDFSVTSFSPDPPLRVDPRTSRQAIETSSVRLTGKFRKQRRAGPFGTCPPRVVRRHSALRTEPFGCSRSARSSPLRTVRCCCASGSRQSCRRCRCPRSPGAASPPARRTLRGKPCSEGGAEKVRVALGAAELRRFRHLRLAARSPWRVTRRRGLCRSNCPWPPPGNRTSTGALTQKLV